MVTFNQAKAVPIIDRDELRIYFYIETTLPLPKPNVSLIEVGNRERQPQLFQFYHSWGYSFMKIFCL